MNIKPIFTTWNLHNSKIFLRIDGNVPLINGVVQNDFRLQNVKPTIDHLLSQGAQLIIGTHIGRPEGSDPTLSTQHLMPWFQKQGYDISFAQTIEQARTQQHRIILLENLRFFPGEQLRDISFAQELAKLTDYYVNDAFGTLHRNDTSITLLAQQFPPTHRSIGFLIEKEIEKLSQLMHTPQKPFVLILGGKKVREKLPIIENLLPHIDHIVLLPALCFTFLKALDKSTGVSLIAPELLQETQKLIKQAAQNKVTIHLPSDYLIAEDKASGKIEYNTSGTLREHEYGISIGPKTILELTPLIANAGTIFFNGISGLTNRPETMKEMEQLIKLVATTNAYTVVGGGDTAAFAQEVNTAQTIGYISTGGGATLHYIAGLPLAGLTAMK